MLEFWTAFHQYPLHVFVSVYLQGDLANYWSVMHNTVVFADFGAIVFVNAPSVSLLLKLASVTLILKCCTFFTVDQFYSEKK